MAFHGGAAGASDGVRDGRIEVVVVCTVSNSTGPSGAAPTL